MGDSRDFPRYPRVLVAVDNSAAAAVTLGHVVPYALQQRSQLTLLSVVPKPPTTAVWAGVSPQHLAQPVQSEFAASLRRLASTLPQELPVRTLLRHGDPASEILALLAEESFDLLCMGARGRGRIANALLGSVSAEVLHESPIPVVIFHRPPAQAEPAVDELPNAYGRAVGPWATR
jgi:nucleotide-binding universal stress UspA family protein